MRVQAYLGVSSCFQQPLGLLQWSAGNGLRSWYEAVFEALQKFAEKFLVEKSSAGWSVRQAPTRGARRWRNQKSENFA